MAVVYPHPRAQRGLLAGLRELEDLLARDDPLPRRHGTDRGAEHRRLAGLRGPGDEDVQPSGGGQEPCRMTRMREVRPTTTESVIPNVHPVYRLPLPKLWRT